MQDNMDRFYSMLGLAVKAGKVASGSFMVEQEVRQGRARLVILTGDIGPAVSKKIIEGCERYGIPMIGNGDRERLSHAAGKEDRSCFAVTDAGFAGALLKIYTTDRN